MSFFIFRLIYTPILLNTINLIRLEAKQFTIKKKKRPNNYVMLKK